MRLPYRIGGGAMPESRLDQFLPEQHEYLAATMGMGEQYHKKGERPLGVSMWILGYIDLTTGERRSAKDILIWEPTDDELQDDRYITLFREQTIYRVRCHPPLRYTGMLSGLFVTEIIKAGVRNPFLSELIREYKDGLHLMSEMFGDMQIKDEYEAYSARFGWLGTDIEVTVSGEYSPYTNPLSYLEAFCREAGRHDRELREFAAAELLTKAIELTGTALTEEGFAEGMKVNCIEMYYDGDYEAFLSFGDYEINVCGDTKGPKKAYIDRRYEY